MKLYNDNVMALFFDTRHRGMLDCSRPLTVCSRIQLAKNKCCELYLAGDQHHLIIAAQFKAMGDPFLIAGLEWVCRKIVSTSVVTPCHIDYQMLLDALSIPKIRYATALLVESSYRQAISLLQQAYLEKNHE